MALEAWLLQVALAAAAPAGDKPGGDRICVPAEDGRSWECGTREHPPPQRGLPPRPDRASPEPPPFLADPNRGRLTPGQGAEVTALPEPEPQPAAPLPDAFPPASPKVDPASTDAPAETAEVTGTPEPAAAEPATSSADDVAASAESAPSEPSAEPIATTEPEPGSEPPPMLARPLRRQPVPLAPVEAPEPAPTPATVSAIEPAARADEPTLAGDEAEPAAEPAVTEASAPIGRAPAEPLAVAEPPRSAEAAPLTQPAPAPRDANEFLARPASGYTIQLARADSSAGFGELLVALGLDADSAYALPLAGTDRTWWVLVWSSFADPVAARAAIASLRAGVLAQGAVPRRIAPLHDELRRLRGPPR
jgi:septal ring-binding cell division protein DamX